MVKEILTSVAIILTFIAFAPYIRGILWGEIRPHLFSWIIWATTTLIAFVATLKGGGGIGAWPIGLSGLLVVFITVLAWRRQSDHSITRLDWVFLIAAFASLPVWFITNDPLWAVIILTIVDLLGFGPTLRKAYHQPYEEGVSLFAIYAFRNLLVIGAMEVYSVTTLLFPVAIAIACLAVIVLLLWRRRVQPPTTTG